MAGRPISLRCVLSWRQAFSPAPTSEDVTSPDSKLLALCFQAPDSPLYSFNGRLTGLATAVPVFWLALVL